VLASLEEYAATGRGDIRSVVNIKPPQFRLRVGDWRIRFRRHDQEQELEILHVLHRSKAYDR